MPIELPTVPALVLTLVNLFAPYLIAVVNRPEWSPTAKRGVAVLGSLVLTAASLALYYTFTGEPVPSIPKLLILGVLVSQTAYALLEKPSAKVIEAATSPKG